MGPLEPRPESRSTLPGSQLVLDERVLGCVESLRPMAWVVLEAVALAATVEDQVLMAHTSARQLAQLLGLDPGTAAAALRLLRKRGLLELRRTGGEAGRFGLSAYVLGDVATIGLRPCVTPPGAVAPHAADPHAERRCRESGTTPPLSSQASGSRRPAHRPAEQGAFELGIEDDR